MVLAAFMLSATIVRKKNNDYASCKQLLDEKKKSDKIHDLWVSFLDSCTLHGFHFCFAGNPPVKENLITLQFLLQLDLRSLGQLRPVTRCHTTLQGTLLDILKIIQEIFKQYERLRKLDE